MADGLKKGEAVRSSRALLFDWRESMFYRKSPKNHRRMVSPAFEEIFEAQRRWKDCSEHSDPGLKSVVSGLLPLGPHGSIHVSLPVPK